MQWNSKDWFETCLQSKQTQGCAKCTKKERDWTPAVYRARLQRQQSQGNWSPFATIFDALFWQFLTAQWMAVTQTGPQSLIRINTMPQSFLFSWEVSLALILVPTLPGVFLAFHHWSLPPLWLNQHHFTWRWGVGTVSLHHLAVISTHHFVSCLHFPASLPETAGYTSCTCHNISQKGVCRPPTLQNQEGCLGKNAASLIHARLHEAESPWVKPRNLCVS